MKTKEQIIEWLKGQEWYNEFCVKAGFRDEGELEEYVENMMQRPKDLISTAFVWPQTDHEFWSICEYTYLKWFKSEDEKPEEATEIKENKAEDKFIFDRGSREAPFYMVYVEGQSSPTYKHGTMESATEEADRLAKVMNKKSFVLAAVMEIRPEIVTSAISIENMQKEEDYPF